MTFTSAALRRGVLIALILAFASVLAACFQALMLWSNALWLAPFASAGILSRHALIFDT